MILHKGQTFEHNGTTVDLEVDTRDLHWGKFDNGMAVYLYDTLMNGNEGEQSASDSEGSGTWAERYGKRILSGDDQGFIYCQTFPTVAEAEATMNAYIPEVYGPDDEDEDEDEDEDDGPDMGAEMAHYHPSER